MENDGSEAIDVEALEKMMKEKLCGESPLSAKCCIFKVPKVLRRHRPEAYEPEVVSIGPFYHYSSHDLFQSMGKVKQWYLNTLLLRMNSSLLDLIQAIAKDEKLARDYYAESLAHISPNEFIEIMITDGCFLLELFQRSYHGYKEESVNDDDPIFNMDCMISYLCHDLVLLENQLPWFILEALYSHIICDKERVPLTKLVLKFFSRLHSLIPYCNRYLKHNHDDEEILHILDLIRSAVIVPHEIDIIPKTKSGDKQESPTTLAHATALAKAGVVFRTRKDVGDVGLLSVGFDPRNGVLTIPHLHISEIMEPLFRNVIAFEQCYHDRRDQLTSYALLMDSLIASTEDVDFLYDKDIINKWLSPEEAFQLFDNLCCDTLITSFSYGGLCKQVDEYHRHRRIKWRAMFMLDYCSSPWKIISLVAGIFLLLITTLETIYAILAYHLPQ